MASADASHEEDEHLDVISAIAKETNNPLSVVRRIYEAELARLRADARITDYVALFAGRRTRDALLQQGDNPPAESERAQQRAA